MRWVTYRQAGGGDRVGLVENGTVHALDEGLRLLDVLGDDGEGLAAAGARARTDPSEMVDLKSISLRAPIPRPPSIRDYSSFAEHIENGLRAIGKELGADYYRIPIFYFTNPGMVYGTGDTVRGPGNTHQLDFELEVAAVIGRPGVDLDPGEAEQVIAGYCIYNDWSARDLQRQEQHTMPVGPGKGKDFAQTFGPCLVTPDELEPYRSKLGFDLAMSATVNGREYSRGNFSTIMWSFGEMIAHASRGVQLVPGDIIGSGTVATGCILEQSTVHSPEEYPWLKDGDEVALEVEQLGRIVNTVTFGPEPSPLEPRLAAAER